MDTDLRSRVVALEQGSAQREQRLVNLEQWRSQQDIQDARIDEKWRHLDERFLTLDKKITDIGASLTYINRLLIGGIMAGVVTFLLRGGFHLPLP